MNVLKLLFFINLFLFPPAFSEEVSVESGEESRATPALDRQSLVHDSAQCRNAPATAKDWDLQSIVASDLQRNILARSYAHILESAHILKSHGILRHQDLTSSHPALQSVKTSCTKYPFQAEVTQKALPLLDAQTSVPVSAEAAQVQKRYLMAAVEAQRLKNMIKDNYFHGQERARMMERLGKIMQHYPMAMGGYANAQALAAQMGTGTNLLRERATHPEIEKFLFPNAQGQFEVVSPTVNASSSGAQLLNRLIGSERLPEPVLRDLGSSMIQAFRPVLTAMGGLCQSSPCQTIAISPTPIAESLNRMPAATRQTHLNAVCQCKLGKNQSMLPDGITEAAGVGALGTAGLCLFSGVGCGPAIVLGLVATSYANVNVYSSLNNILENQRSSNIARDLPGLAAGDVEQLRSYREGIYRDLGISAAVGVAGYGVLRGASSLVQNHGSNLVRKFKNLLGQQIIVPQDHIVLSHFRGGILTRALDADGRQVFSIITTKGIERLNISAEDVATISRLQNSTSGFPNLTNTTSIHPSPNHAVAEIAVPHGQVVLSRLESGALTRALDNQNRPVYSLVTRDGIEQLRMDPSGMAISANNESIRRIAHQEIESGGRSILFIDVNHLGKINYTQGGSQSGDAYLAAVARTISERVGPEATVYRWGGDEFLVVLKNQNASEIRRISQNISDSIISHAPTREIFRAEKIRSAQNYRAVFRAANSFDQLPPTFRSQLTSEELAFASRSPETYQRFRDHVLKVQERVIRESASVQPTVSIGSAIVGGNYRTASTAIAAADAEAAKVKINYRAAVGLDTEKYLGRPSYLPPEEVLRRPRFLRTAPEALDPAQ